MKDNEIFIPSSTQPVELIKRISSGGVFSYIKRDNKLIFKTIRKFGNRGIFRLLLPRAEVRVKIENQILRYKVVNDFWARWMLVVLTAGMIVELLMDRQKYPRDYPIEFICALFVYFWAMTFYEKATTRRRFDNEVWQHVR